MPLQQAGDDIVLWQGQAERSQASRQLAASPASELLRHAAARGGFITSTLLTLVALPSAYRWLLKPKSVTA